MDKIDSRCLNAPSDPLASGGNGRLFFHRCHDRRTDRRDHRAVSRQKRGWQPTLNRKALDVRRAQEQEDQDWKNGEHSTRVS